MKVSFLILYLWRSMIPLKLHIKNFVSYGNSTQVIDFEPYHFICFSGKNGHGKSALLDAITWSIWGQARKALGSSKADEGLLRLGQTNMLVALEFICNGQVYKIRREFTLAGTKSHTNLEFGMLDAETGHIKPLTDKTIRSTQDKIDSLIGLTYESFINSAFLRQGHSNEFSKKSPKDRKELLANILGLDTFEALRKKAFEKSKEALLKKEQLTHMHSRIMQSLAQKSVLSFNHSEIAKELAAIDAQELEIKQKYHALELQKTHVALQKKNYDIVNFKLEQISQALQEKIAYFTDAIATYRVLLVQEKIAHNSQQLQKEYVLYDEHIVVLEKKIAEYLVNKEKSFVLQQKVVAYTNTLQQQMQSKLDECNKQEHAHTIALKNYAAKSQELTQLEHTYAQEQIKLNEQIQKVTDSLSSFKAREQELPILQLQFEKRKASYHKWIAKANGLSLELKALEQKSHFTSSAHNPQCPLCYQDLSAQKKQALLSDFEDLKHRYQLALTRYTSGISCLKELLVKQHADLDKQVLEQSQQMQLLERANNLEETKQKNMLAIQKVRAELLTVRSTQETEMNALKNVALTKEALVLQHTAWLDNDVSLATMRLELKELHAMDHEIDIIYQLHKEYKEKRATLKTSLQNLEQFNGKIAFKQEHKKAISAAGKAIKILKKQKHDLLLEFEGCKDIQQDEQAALFQELMLKSNAEKLQTQKMHFVHQKGSLEQQLFVIEKQQEEHEQQKKTIAELTETAEEYQAIATALSKDGIQALLIEDAIPEIEQEANRILGRLTDNQAHIIIDSLRDLKGGGARETLDIKISDSIGIRPYELFSGGEAFRIDFSLRIAISKMLARRAGTALQTLIIDEGFGSQDDEGLSNIMDALYKIQEDFAKVIIVSHLPVMKEQFPVHFMIYKGAHGSTVKVVENG